VGAERRDPGHPWVLDTGVVQPALPALVRREYDAFAADAGRYAVGELDGGQADPGYVARSNQSRQQVQGPVPSVPGRGFNTPSVSKTLPGSGVIRMGMRVSV
jgi:hypothetical protein